MSKKPKTSARTRETRSLNQIIGRIKDLPPNQSLGGVRFRHPQTGAICIWLSQWGYKDGKAGVWYKTDDKSSQVYPLPLDKLEEALDFEVVQTNS
jgi:hypothetical protein